MGKRQSKLWAQLESRLILSLRGASSPVELAHLQSRGRPLSPPCQLIIDCVTSLCDLPASVPAAGGWAHQEGRRV